MVICLYILLQSVWDVNEAANGRISANLAANTRFNGKKTAAEAAVFLVSISI
jgi:hypothetical protein